MKDNTSTSLHCPFCGKEINKPAKYCTECGSEIPEKVAKLLKEMLQQQSIQPNKEETDQKKETLGITKKSSTWKIFLSKIINFIMARKVELIIFVGFISILSAVTVGLLLLLLENTTEPGVLITLPPLNDYLFDLLITFVLVLFIFKEILVKMKHIDKNKQLDYWIAFSLIITNWFNLLVLGLGFIDKSIFLELITSTSVLFIMTSIIVLAISGYYYYRFMKTEQYRLFSFLLIINLATVVYLLVWLIEIPVIGYTMILIVFLIIAIIITALIKEIYPFNLAVFLLSSIMLSPQLLSNSIVIMIGLVLIAVPIESFLIKKYLLLGRPTKSNDKFIYSFIGESTNVVGLITIALAIFYGFLSDVIGLVFIGILIAEIVALKLLDTKQRINSGQDWTLQALLMVTIVFYDLSTINNLMLFAISLLAVIYSVISILEYSFIKNKLLSNITGFLFLLTITVISLTLLDFYSKGIVIILSQLALLIIHLKKGLTDNNIGQLSIFAAPVTLIISFYSTPLLETTITIPIALVIVLSLIQLYFIASKANDIQYSKNLVILMVLLEIMSWSFSFLTVTVEQLLIPEIALLITVVGSLALQLRRQPKNSYAGINGTPLVFLGLIGLINEFDPLVMLVLAVVLTLVATIILIKQQLTLNKVIAVNSTTDKAHSLVIVLNGLGLGVLLLFEELDPIVHFWLLTLIPLQWIIVNTVIEKGNDSYSPLLIVVTPILAYLLELLLAGVIFTPITKIDYLLPTLLALVIPIYTYKLVQQGLEIVNKNRLVFNSNYFSPFYMGNILLILTYVLAITVYQINKEIALLLLCLVGLSLLMITFGVNRLYELLLALTISILLVINYPYLELEQIFVDSLIPFIPVVVTFIFLFTNKTKPLISGLCGLITLGYVLLYPVINVFATIVTTYNILLMATHSLLWYLVLIKNRQKFQEPIIIAILNLIALITVLIGNFDDLMTISSIIIENKDIYFLSELSLTLSMITAIIMIPVTIITHHCYYKDYNLTLLSQDNKIRLFTISSYFLTFSFLILQSIGAIIRYSTLSVELLLYGVLTTTLTLLIILQIISKTNIFGLRKSAILMNYLSTILAWLLISSIMLENPWLLFVWIIIGFELIFQYLKNSPPISNKNDYLLWGAIYQLTVGVSLIIQILDLIMYGQISWLLIVGLIIFGIEIITLGLYYSSRSQKRPITDVS